MQISIVLNGKKIQEEIEPDLLLIDFVRKHGCKSVKRGCETSGCGLCTVFLDDKPVLSGYEGQLRGIQNFLVWKKEKRGEEVSCKL